jgi:hypothetical protein
MAKARKPGTKKRNRKNFIKRMRAILKNREVLESLTKK